MAYDGWLTYGGVEIGNVARVRAYSEQLALDPVRLVEDYEWLRNGLGDDPYLLSYAEPDGVRPPWADADRPEGERFAGVIITSARGLEDSTRAAEVFEYTIDGGRVGRLRHGTKTIVFEAALVGADEEAVEYGFQWLKQALRQRDCVGTSRFCTGEDLNYLAAPMSPSSAGTPAEWVDTKHRTLRDVIITRGPQVTGKRRTACDTIWVVTFTAVAGDSFEYGLPRTFLEDLGEASDPYVAPYTGSSAMDVLVDNLPCPAPVWDPVYDPAYPAATPPPAPPEFYPDGWDVPTGPDTWYRTWADIPTSLIPEWDSAVPIITVGPIADDARYLRLRIYDTTAFPIDSSCPFLWEAVIGYVPGNHTLVIDGVQQAIYVWDGFSTNVRRADALTFGTDARPMLWPALSCNRSLRFAVEYRAESDTDERPPVGVSLTPRSA